MPWQSHIRIPNEVSSLGEISLLDDHQSGIILDPSNKFNPLTHPGLKVLVHLVASVHHVGYLFIDSKVLYNFVICDIFSRGDDFIGIHRLCIHDEK
ncbi:hypothetical protein D3C76_1511250 [compost metagenome]